MADLWQLARSIIPAVLPETQPLDVSLGKTDVRRDGLIEPTAGQLVAVVTGHVSEWLHPAEHRQCIVREYGVRDLVVNPAGRLRADTATTILCFSAGWDVVLPELAAVVDMLRRAEAHDLKHRLASAMCLSVTERIQQHVAALQLDPKTISRTRLAHVLGGSREMANRVLLAMAKGAA